MLARSGSQSHPLKILDPPMQRDLATAYVASPFHMNLFFVCDFC